jgi:dihydropteroate synthase
MPEQAAARPVERILFLTGHLALKSLHRTLDEMQPLPFVPSVLDVGINVAGLMTAELIRRRVPVPVDADRIIVPGRCRGDLDALAQHYGVPVQRGPDEVKDLPLHFGRKAKKRVLDRHDVLIFAEIVDAPQVDVEAVLATARRYRRDGADVVDIGCLPDTPFPHMEDCIRALKAEGFMVSVDSLNTDDLIRGAHAGADYLLSLKKSTLWVADEVDAIPILIPDTPGDLDSLREAIDIMSARGEPFYADPIIEPIHFGFTASIVRYHELRRTHPDVPMMMGVGNLTELTDADTSGINALLFGIISELRVGAVLATEVSPHARRAVKEADWARRIMFAARDDNALPRDYADELMTTHQRRPFPDSPEEIADMAAAVRDPNFRIQLSAQGIHVYNRDGMQVDTDPFALYPGLDVADDGAHAFYLGVELARAQIAWQLGRRYAQDEELQWGAAVDRKTPDLMAHCAPGTTLQRKTKRRPAAGADGTTPADPAAPSAPDDTQD